MFLEFHGSQTSIEEQIDTFRTITADHGGSGKREYMRAEHGAAYDLMRQLKSTIDPNNIMNPGKIFTQDE